MPSKIEPNEYKDYILAFIFYKFLSDKEVRFMHKKAGGANVTATGSVRKINKYKRIMMADETKIPKNTY